LTICTHDRRPVFRDDEAAAVVVDGIRALHDDGSAVLGYCVMPDHVHALVMVRARSALDFVRLLKGRTTVNLRDLGYRKVWQTSFHDHIVRRDEDLAAVLQYVLENPVRKGIVKEWARYRWCGSFEWSEIDVEFFVGNRNGISWSEIFEGGGGGG
jgi:REP element-mobilizing transposase RayT